ncbi:MAG: 50S ribosomal protein L4 [Bacilli bacterium]|nr:50S ribosomal protein L4 [Bacilli bacterium]
MPKIALLNIKGEKIKDIKLNDEVWAIEPNDNVLYDAVVLAQASLRQGTHKVKTRSEVRGGGKKPWRQKGTGRARAGSIRAPHWRGGGIVFGPQPRSYDKKMNKKERRLALKSALSYKVLENELKALDSFVLANEKTKTMIDTMKILNIDKSVLIVTSDLNDNLILASRNMKNIKVISSEELNAFDVVCYDYLVITEEAIKNVEEVLS